MNTPDISEIKTYFDAYVKAYHDSPSYREFKPLRDKIISDAVMKLLTLNTLDELAKIWFINYGCMNGWGHDTSFRHEIAYKLHELHKAAYPEQHSDKSYDKWRCYHVSLCVCGFGSECDSSD